jgi:hypothetical protein
MVREREVWLWLVIEGESSGCVSGGGREEMDKWRECSLGGGGRGVFLKKDSR